MARNKSNRKPKNRGGAFAAEAAANREAAEVAKAEKQQAFIASYDHMHEREMSGEEALYLCKSAIEAKIFDDFGQITSAVKNASLAYGALSLLHKRLQDPETTDASALMSVLAARIDSLRVQKQAVCKSNHGKKGAPALKKG